MIMAYARNVLTQDCRINEYNGQDRDRAAAILQPSGIGPLADPASDLQQLS